MLTGQLYSVARSCCNLVCWLVALWSCWVGSESRQYLSSMMVMAVGGGCLLRLVRVVLVVAVRAVLDWALWWGVVEEEGRVPGLSALVIMMMSGLVEWRGSLMSWLGSRG